MPENTLYVTATVHTEDPSVVPRIVEALGRAVTGLALEGLLANISIGSFADDDE